MNQLPLHNLIESLELYKHMHSTNPSFGMDIYKKDFKIDDFLILENNGDGRSVPYIRCGYYILILSLKGTSVRYINQHKYTIEPQSLQLIVPGAIHSFEDTSKEQDSYLILFNKEFLLKNFEELLEFHKIHPTQIKTQGCEFAAIKSIFEQIDDEYKTKNHEYKEIIKTYISQILLLLKRKKLSSYKSTQESRSQQIMNNYLELIEEHYQTKKKVSEYAEILELTPKHLSETVKELSNKPALFYIHIRILKEIRYLLVYSNLSVKQISCSLNFESSSELGRFFKKLEGISPSKYRLSLQNP